MSGAYEDPGHNLILPAGEPFQAAWTFTSERGARDWMEILQADHPGQRLRLRIVQRTIRALGARIPIWLLLIP